MSRTLMATSSPSVAERRVDDGRELDPQADPAPGTRPGESLKHIELLASGHKSLTPLERCRALVSGRFSKFPKAEVRGSTKQPVCPTTGCRNCPESLRAN